MKFYRTDKTNMVDILKARQRKDADFSVASREARVTVLHWSRQSLTFEDVRA